MPILDSCITANFEPGAIGASSGTPPTVIIPGSGLDPGTYDPDSVTYSLDFSKFYNSMYLLLLMAGGGPATLGGGGGPPVTDPPLISGPGNISLTQAERQNTHGFAEAFPKDVPISYDWYDGPQKTGQVTAPSGFTAMTGHGQVYQEVGTSDATIPGLIEIRNQRSYVQLADLSWVLVQNETSLDGAHFVGDFGPGASLTLDINDIGGGVWTMDGPPVGYNNHWWPNPRGTYTADTVVAAFTIFEIRVTDPAAVDRLVADAGIDWWLDVGAPYVDPVGTNNPAAGVGNWVKVTTTFKPVCFYSFNDSASGRAAFEASLPPPVIP